MGLFGKKKEASTVDTSSLTTYTVDEVKAHKTKDSLWIIIEGLIYDVTKWQADHPGGDEVLLELGGEDATVSFDDVGHSKDARKQLRSFLIGKLA